MEHQVLQVHQEQVVVTEHQVRVVLQDRMVLVQVEHITSTKVKQVMLQDIKY